MSNSDKLTTWAQRYADSLRPQVVPKNSPVSTPSNVQAASDSVPLPIGFGNFSFMGQGFGEGIHKIVQADYRGYEVIEKVTYDSASKIVKGSNPFYVVAVNEVLRRQHPRLRTATQADLEYLLKNNFLSLQGQYEDTALVWRSNEGDNEYLARDIARQCEAGRVNLVKGKPVVFPLFEMRLRKDDSSPHKLSFDLGTCVQHFKAPILRSASGSYINPAEMDDKTGLPTKVYTKAVSGNRQLWTRTDGLSRLYLYRNLNVSSDNDDLANSGDYGRVVLVSAAGAPFAK